MLLFLLNDPILEIQIESLLMEHPMPNHVNVLRIQLISIEFVSWDVITLIDLLICLTWLLSFLSHTTEREQMMLLMMMLMMKGVDDEGVDVIK